MLRDSVNEILPLVVSAESKIFNEQNDDGIEKMLENTPYVLKEIKH